jgi:hypothetical protein
VIHCEVLTGGNPALLDQEPFAERRDSRIDYSKIFGDQSSQPESGATPAKRARPASVSAKKPKANVTPAKHEAKTSGTPAKAGGGAVRTPKSGKKSGEQKTPKAASVKKESAKKNNSPAVRTAVSSPAVARPAGSQKMSNDHKVRILAAPATPYHIDRTPQGGGGGSGRSDGADKKSAGGYTCHTCGFTATRLNVIVLHSKTHSAPASNNSSRSNFAAATPPKSSPGGAKKPEKERPFRDDRVTSTSKPRKRDKGAAAAAPKARGAAAAVAGGPAAKKARLTKKQREEKREQEERKEAERRRLLGDWSEDEHQEEEEYKKLQVSCSLLSSSLALCSTVVFYIPYSVLRIRNVYPGSEFFPSRIPGTKKIPGSRIRTRIEEFKYFNPKKLLLSSRQYDPGCSSRIRILIFYHPGSWISDPGKGSRIRIRNTSRAYLL